MAEASIIVNDENVRKALKELADKVKNPVPVLNEIGEAGLTGIQDIFQDEGPPGDRWPDLAPSTKKERIALGKWPGKILQRTGASGLVGSINYKAHGGQNARVVWGTNKVYARVQHYGYRPKSIPARPFMVITDERMEKFREIIKRYLMET